MSKTKLPPIDKTKLLSEPEIAARVEEFLNTEIEVLLPNGYGLHKFKPSEFYKKEDLQRIKDGLSRQCFGKNNDEINNGIFKQATEIFIERQNVRRQYSNVKRQELRIKQYEIKPGNVTDIAALIEQRQAPIYYFGNGEEVGDNFWSKFGGSEKERNEILNRNTDLIHTKMPDKNYRNNVLDLERECINNIRANDASLNNLLKWGKPLTEEEKKERFHRDNQFLRRSSNFVEYTSSKAVDAVNWLGRGMISDSNVAKDSRMTKYLSRRNELLDKLFARLGSNNLLNSSYLQTLQKSMKFLADTESLDDMALAGEMENFINAESKAIKELNDKKLEELQNAINSDNENFLKGGGGKRGLEALLEEEDAEWKWKLLCLIMIVSPFSPGMIVGGAIFNYLGPIMQFLEPIFSSGDLASGIAGILENPMWGPLADLNKSMHSADGIEWLLNNTPVVNGVLDLADELIFNDIVSNATNGVGLPFINSPLFLLGAAALMAGDQGHKIMKHHIEETEILDSHKAKQKKTLENFKKEIDKGMDSRVENVAKQYFEAKIATKYQAKLVKEIVKNPELFKKIFSEIKSVDKEGNVLEVNFLEAILDSVDINSDKGQFQLITAIQKSPYKQEIMNRFFAYKEYENEGGDIIKKFAEIISNPESFKKAVESQTKGGAEGKMRQEVILEMARKADLEGADAKDVTKENLKFFEERLKNKECNLLKEMRNVGPDMHNIPEFEVSEIDGRKISKIPGTSPNNPKGEIASSITKSLGKT